MLKYRWNHIDILVTVNKKEGITLKCNPTFLEKSHSYTVATGLKGTLNTVKYIFDNVLHVTVERIKCPQIVDSFLEQGPVNIDQISFGDKLHNTKFFDFVGQGNFWVSIANTRIGLVPIGMQFLDFNLLKLLDVQMPLVFVQNPLELGIDI